MSKKMIELPCDRCIHSKVCSRKGAYSKDGVCEYFDEKRQQGEWIMNKTSARGRNYTCTNCQKVSRNKSEFCPKCGADMRKGGAE